MSHLHPSQIRRRCGAYRERLRLACDQACSMSSARGSSGKENSASMQESLKVSLSTTSSRATQRMVLDSHIVLSLRPARARKARGPAHKIRTGMDRQHLRLPGNLGQDRNAQEKPRSSAGPGVRRDRGSRGLCWSSDSEARLHALNYGLPLTT